MQSAMRTTFLFAIPTFFSGCARLLDLGSVYDLYNVSQDESVADARALYSDFRMVGQDLQKAMERFSTANHDELTPQQLWLALQQNDVEVGHGTQR